MQPTDARKTFPCFDEPAIKAKFKITLVRKSHMITLSNTPIVNEEQRYIGIFVVYVVRFLFLCFFRYIATSMMAPIDARKALPCFDEPAIKTIFRITLIRKSHMTSLSNTPIQHSVDRYIAYIGLITSVMYI